MKMTAILDYFKSGCHTMLNPRGNVSSISKGNVILVLLTVSHMLGN